MTAGAYGGNLLAAAVSIGIFLVALHGWARWLACLVRIILSALTLQVLGAPWWPALVAVAAAVMGGLLGDLRSLNSRT
ncbi:hypothetical protein [Microbulbifer elongatus]|uniref:hypothetical protein n=1 Tax=Microbulbifer elongatus TaxID=86173 RepID=UPI001E4952D9|nr:hypothetical protein [Microbulbifer elongatus]